MRQYFLYLAFGLITILLIDTFGNNALSSLQGFHLHLVLGAASTFAVLLSLLSLFLGRITAMIALAGYTLLLPYEAHYFFSSFKDITDTSIETIYELLALLFYLSLLAYGIFYSAKVVRNKAIGWKGPVKKIRERELGLLVVVWAYAFWRCFLVAILFGMH